MANKSVTLHIRIFADVYERLRTLAESKRWSVAGCAAILLEEALTHPNLEPAAPAAPQPQATQTPVQAPRPEREVDRFLDVLKRFLATDGFDKVEPDGS